MPRSGTTSPVSRLPLPKLLRSRRRSLETRHIGELEWRLSGNFRSPAASIREAISVSFHNLNAAPKAVSRHISNRGMRQHSCGRGGRKVRETHDASQPLQGAVARSSLPRTRREVAKSSRRPNTTLGNAEKVLEIALPQ